MRLTQPQRFVLDMLHEAGPLNTHEIAEGMAEVRGRPVSYDRAHSILARLHRRGLVHRERLKGEASRWYITADRG